MIVIGLVGRAGSGKTTVADYLVERLHFQRAKFATALKGMMRALLAYRGADPHTIERMIEGDLKEIPSPYLAGKTPRYAMQTLGTEWGRDRIDKDFWVDSEMGALERQFSSARLTLSPPMFVFDDVRFANEVEAIRASSDGILVRIARAAADAIEAGHESERLEVSADVVIQNEADKRSLFLAVDDLVSRLRGRNR
ncbi:deoxynucleotide monophosphate kinase [Amorphus sp. MBR-141]